MASHIDSRGQRYDDVFFLNENLGWAVKGYYAAVYKTEDGGINWTEQINETELGSDLYFRNIEFIDEKVGFLGTLNGKFYKTSDGGVTWELVSITPNPAAICGLDAVGENIIYGCGAYFTPAFIIKSTDKGNTWRYFDMSAYAIALVEIKFWGESIGYASGYNTDGACVLKTTDGAESWTEIYNSNKGGQYVWKLQILNDNPDTIFGSVESLFPNPGMLIKSLDSGTTWTELEAPEHEIQAVGFVTKTHGWMGGHTTDIFGTTDGGITWTDLNIGSDLNRIFVIDEGLVFAAGTSIYKYTDEALGIEEQIISNSKNLKITLENNPVKTKLELSIEFESPDNLLIELYDIKGQFIKVLSKSSIPQPKTVHFSFDVETLSAGTYIISFHYNFNRQTLKFIKE